MKKKIILCTILLLLSIISFLVFFSSSYKLGGDALNGFSLGGKFYVNAHGSLKEVSETAWNLNRIEGYMTFAFFNSALFTIFITYFQYKKIKMKIKTKK